MSKKRIVVAGGNGFLGSRICKSAVVRGWEVTSISRSGEPTWSSVTSSPTAPPWSTSVKWAKGDILKPATYKPLLAGVDAVVHTMGILLEADYKGVVSGRESPIAGLQRAFSPMKMGAQGNPLERNEGDELKPKERDGHITYELMNRDSGRLRLTEWRANADDFVHVAIALAHEASVQNVPAFVYISAAAGVPVLPQRYITTKREAESTIASSLPRLRSVFVRPGFLYDSSRKFTLPIAVAGGIGSQVNSVVGGRLSWLMGAAVEKPLKADLVAEAVVEAIESESTKGVVGTKEIENLANKAWRRGML